MLVPALIQRTKIGLVSVSNMTDAGGVLWKLCGSSTETPLLACNYVPGPSLSYAGCYEDISGANANCGRVSSWLRWQTQLSKSNQTIMTPGKTVEDIRVTTQNIWPVRTTKLRQELRLSKRS
jgi:hypothetical protein